MSEYSEWMKKEQLDLIRREERKQELQKVYDRNCGNLEQIKQKYSLYAEDEELLQEIKEESDHQEELDQAFLEGFTGKKQS